MAPTSTKSGKLRERGREKYKIKKKIKWQNKTRPKENSNEKSKFQHTADIPYQFIFTHAFTIPTQIHTHTLLHLNIYDWAFTIIYTHLSVGFHNMYYWRCAHNGNWWFKIIIFDIRFYEQYILVSLGIMKTFWFNEILHIFLFFFSISGQNPFASRWSWIWERTPPKSKYNIKW